jgi:hypothetical protein
MTCRRRENDLALYVEGDLPADRIPALEDHLRECPVCGGFFAELAASQKAVRDLAAEPIGGSVQAAVRARIASAGTRPPRHGAAAWGVAVAAGLAAVAAATYWLAQPSVLTPDSVGRATPPAASSASESGPKRPALAALQPAERAPEHEQSLVRPERPISLHAESRRPASALSSEDADQLARAVVAVSRIDRVTDAVPEPPPSPIPATLVRLATDDPDIVIYWRLDSDGGE